MSLHSAETTAVSSENTAEPPENAYQGRVRRMVVNWVLALLTVPAAAFIVISAVGAALSLAACSTAHCPSLGPHGLVYGVLLYGAPIVAGLSIIASVFTAFRRRGFVVPLIGLGFLLADFAALMLFF